MSVTVYPVFALYCVKLAALRQADPRSKGPTDCVWIRELKRRLRSKGLYSHRETDMQVLIHYSFSVQNNQELYFMVYSAV